MKKKIPFFSQLDAKLKGEPDSVLTVILILLAVFAMLIAFAAPPLLKVAVILYFIFP